MYLQNRLPIQDGQSMLAERLSTTILSTFINIYMVEFIYLGKGPSSAYYIIGNNSRSCQFHCWGAQLLAKNFYFYMNSGANHLVYATVRASAL
jgi:hypothetical protein